MRFHVKNYKDYPFPLALLLVYLIGCTVGVVLLHLLAAFLLATDSAQGFLETVLSVAACLVAFVVELFLLAFLICAVDNKKIYRGIGLFRFLNAVVVCAPVLFIGTVVALNAAQVAYAFFQFCVLLLEFAFPATSALAVRLFTDRCRRCGLLNTFKISAVKTEDLGLHHKFHEEREFFGTVTTPVYDGMFEYKKTTTEHTCSACGYLKKETKNTETKWEI